MKPPSLLIAVPVFYVVLFVVVFVLVLTGGLTELRDIGDSLHYVGFLFWHGHTAYLYADLQRTIPLWQIVTVVAVLGTGLALALWKLRGWYRIAATLVLLFAWMYFGIGILFTNL